MWHLDLVGWAWWAVLPAAVGLGWLAARLMGPELAAAPPPARRGIALLRGTAVACCVVLLAEPALGHRSTRRELPAVAVVVDASGSMAATDAQMAPGDRLDEAEALGLIPSELRADGPRRAARLFTRLADLAPRIAAIAADAGERDESRQRGVEELRYELMSLYEDGDSLNEPLAGTPAVARHLEPAIQRLEALIQGLSDGQETQLRQVAADLGAADPELRRQAQEAEAAQAAADSALAAGAEAGSPVAVGLERLARMPRVERALLVARRTLAPRLDGRAQVVWFGLADSLRPADGPGDGEAFRPGGGTDLGGAFASLARDRGWTGGVRPGAVVLLSDGRATAGPDPLPAVRSLAARGVRVSALAVGDPGVPRDAVVAELAGPAELFKGETLRLEARLRISGYPDSDWDLVLTRDGEERERRTVRGTGTWQVERFEQPAREAGIATWQVRVSPSRPGGRAAVHTGGGLTREWWGGLPGERLAELRGNEAFPSRPAESATVAAAASADNRRDYGERLIGWLVAPQSGPYTFWISGDDQCELLLADGPDHQALRPIAQVPERVEAGTWDRFESQRSQPVVLEAGRPYAIAILHKQGGDAGHVAVGWQLPDNRLERPIPGTRLAPLGAVAPSAGADRFPPEATIANNQADLTVSVVEDPLRVLLVDAAPRWESRYLCALLERDRRITVDRRYRSIRLPRGERELLPATQEGLDSYDAVVLGDLVPGELSGEDRARLVRFVSRRGGFLAVVSGARGMPAAYALGDLADLLPVRPPGTAPPGPAGPVRAVLTREGASHAITAVLDDPDLNRRLWPLLPPLTWWAKGVVAKPGATVLIEGDDRARTPLVALSRHGAGRVLWLGSDEAWRWRDRLGERVHQTFWLQSLRWGLGARLRGRDQRLQAVVDRTAIEPGGTVEVRARVRDRSGAPIGPAPRVEACRVDESGQEVGMPRRAEMVAVPDADGLWHLPLGDLQEGRWRLTVTSQAPGLADLAEVREIVVRRRAGLEGIELGADLAGLTRLTGAAHGRVAPLGSVDRLVDGLFDGLEPRTVTLDRTWTLWDNWGALLLVVALLLGEWTWRKRVGLP